MSPIFYLAVLFYVYIDAKDENAVIPFLYIVDKSMIELGRL